MLQGFITLYTGEDGFKQFCITGQCLGKLRPQGGYNFEIIVPIESLENVTWDGVDGLPEVIKVNLNVKS